MGGYYAFTILDDHGKMSQLGATFTNVTDSKGVRVYLLPHDQAGAKLTAKGVLFLSKHDPDLIPDISHMMIAERTKSNTLGKAVMIIQVLWFCLNIISRLNEHLPLSLLEVSTLAHGFCTLLSCVVWWLKPLNMDAPSWIRLDSDHTREAFAFMLIANHQTLLVPFRQLYEELGPGANMGDKRTLKRWRQLRLQRERQERELQLRLGQGQGQDRQGGHGREQEEQRLEQELTAEREVVEEKVKVKVEGLELSVLREGEEILMRLALVAALRYGLQKMWLNLLDLASYHLITHPA